MLTGRMERHLWPALLRELQVDPGIGQVHEVAIDVVSQAIDARSVYVNRDASALARRRDDRVAQGLARTGAVLSSWDGLVVHEPGAVLTKKGTLSLVSHSCPAAHQRAG